MADVTYVIEGTIKKLEKENGAWSFRIAGTEGYALRQKKKENDEKEIRLNVLCLENTQVNNDKKPRNAIVLEEDTVFEVKEDKEDTDKEYFYLLSLALANGRKCRVCFSKVEDIKDSNSKNCEITSLALLAE